jgi:DNA-binding PadR family transcriptional regulator
MRYDISRYNVSKEHRMHQYGFKEGEGCGPGAHEFACHHHGQHGPHGPHGFGPFGRARRGMIRAAVLTVLADEPMHGYQIMQQLEERSGGFWRPSAGSVYPTLQLLEDQGLVKSEEVEGKRVFALTDAGKTEAEEIKSRLGTTPWGPGRPGGESRFKLRQSVIQLITATKQVGGAGSQEQIDKAVEILAEARKRLYALLAESE